MNRYHYLLIAGCIILSLTLVAYYFQSEKEIKPKNLTDIEKLNMNKSNGLYLELISIYFTKELREKEVKKFANRYKKHDFNVITIRNKFIDNKTAIIASYNIDKPETEYTLRERRLNNYSDEALLEKITNHNLVERAYFSGKKLKFPPGSTPRRITGKIEIENFYDLMIAYKNGWLFKEELQSILFHVDGSVPAGVENFSPIPKTPESLSEETINQIKRIHVNTASELQKQYYKKRGIYWKDLIVTYYGTYGDFIAVNIDNYFSYIIRQTKTDITTRFDYIDELELNTVREPVIELIQLK